MRLQVAHAGLKRSYFRFSIYKAIRKVLFLEIVDQRSYKSLILDDTDFFLLSNYNIFSNQQTYKHLDLKVHSSCFIKPCVKKSMF